MRSSEVVEARVVRSSTDRCLGQASLPAGCGFCASAIGMSSGQQHVRIAFQAVGRVLDDATAAAAAAGIWQSRRTSTPFAVQAQHRPLFGIASCSRCRPG